MKRIYPLDVVENLNSPNLGDYWITDSFFINLIKPYLQQQEKALIVDCQGLTSFEQVLTQIATLTGILCKEWKVAQLLRSPECKNLIFLSLNLSPDELTKLGVFRETLGSSLRVVVHSDQEIPAPSEIFNYNARIFLRHLTKISRSSDDYWIADDRAISKLYRED